MGSGVFGLLRCSFVVGCQHIGTQSHPSPSDSLLTSKYVVNCTSRAAFATRTWCYYHQGDPGPMMAASGKGLSLVEEGQEDL